ncbi:MAG: nucleotide pyrophosphohydrolase [Verrucomicrobiales bacterium]
MPERTADSITRQILDFRDARDWAQFHSPKDMAMAISIEAAELCEHFLWKSPAECEQRLAERREEVEEEVADIGIYLFELAHNLGIDLLAAMERKIARNGEKYPVEMAKGSNRKYSEFGAPR